MSNDELIFNWRHKFFANRITAKQAQAELSRIRKRYGKLTAKAVLEASRPKKALLHNCFEWDDGIAAEKYREQQARVLINNVQVTIVRSGKDIVDVPYYEVVKDEKGKKSYVDVPTILNDDVAFEFIKMKAKKELEYWKAKYETYDTLKDAVHQVQKVLQLI